MKDTDYLSESEGTHRPEHSRWLSAFHGICWNLRWSDTKLDTDCIYPQHPQRGFAAETETEGVPTLLCNQ